MSERRIDLADGSSVKAHDDRMWINDSDTELLFYRDEWRELLSAIHELTGIPTPVQAPASPDPRQGLRPVDYMHADMNGKKQGPNYTGFLHSFLTANDAIYAVVETPDGFMEPVDICRVRFTDIPATEEAPEPEAKPEAPEIVPGMRVRVAEDAEAVNSDGEPSGGKNVCAGMTLSILAPTFPISDKVAVLDYSMGPYVRLSDLTPVKEEPEAHRFKFGDRVTVDGRQAVIQFGPDDDGDYWVVYENENGQTDYLSPSEITPGWPETETEGEGV